ncbi:MAG: hypothetical protein H6Q15_1665 [Bacteroidetes bacterium]|nr:hypothetical protein [Bacteroidota bacterium]
MKKSYFIGVIIVLLLLLVVNVFFFFNNTCRNNPNVERNIEKQKTKCYISEHLFLKKSQIKEYAIIKSKHQKIAIRITDSLHVSQEMLMDYIKNKPYSALEVNNLENKITFFQKQLLDQSIKQYYQLKSILNEDQISSMDDIYRQIFVCRPTNKHICKCCGINSKRE